MQPSEVDRPAAVDLVVDASQFVCDSVGDVRSETQTHTQVKGVFPALSSIITCSVFVFSPCSGARVGPDHHSSVILHGHDGGLTHNKQTGKRADKHTALIIGQHLSRLNSQLHHPPCPSSSSETVK